MPHCWRGGATSLPAGNDATRQGGAWRGRTVARNICAATGASRGKVRHARALLLCALPVLPLLVPWSTPYPLPPGVGGGVLDRVVALVWVLRGQTEAMPKSWLPPDRSKCLDATAAGT